MYARITIALLLVWAIGCGKNAPTQSEPEITARYVTSQPVQFRTSDGFLIRGILYTASDQTAPRPAVVLIHAFNQDQSQWVGFTPDLVVNRKFVALTFDLRGHGASTLQNGQTRTVQDFTAADLNNMPFDVEAAVAWLKTRPEVDPTDIGVVGADIGANIAFISSGTLADVKTAVSISPQYRENQAQQILIGTDIPGFAPHNVLYLAAFGDGYAYTSAETMATFTKGETKVIGFQGVAHGVDLLNADDAWNAVLDWLSAEL